jgi:hypothetical protein
MTFIYEFKDLLGSICVRVVHDYLCMRPLGQITAGSRIPLGKRLPFRDTLPFL